MIPTAYVTEWATRTPWPTRTQIEQDLLLSRLIIEIANDDYLGSELVFRGGTCLHKLRSPAFRHDLEPFITSGPSGYDIDAAGALVIREVLQWIPTLPRK